MGIRTSGVVLGPVSDTRGPFVGVAANPTRNDLLDAHRNGRPQRQRSLRCPAQSASSAQACRHGTDHCRSGPAQDFRNG